MASYSLGTSTTSSNNGATGLGGLAQDLGIASSYQANGPDADAYNAYLNSTANNEAGYQQQANAAQGKIAPTIVNPYQAASQGQIAGDQGEYGALLNTLNGTITNPNSSLASNTFKQATDQSLAASLALANSTRGGATQQAGAQRAAAEGNAGTLAGASAQSAIVAQNAQQAAVQAAINATQGSGTLATNQYQIEQQNAQDQANLQQQQDQINNNYALGLNQDAVNSNEQQGQGLNSYTSGVNQAQQINSGVAQNAAAGGNTIFGDTLQAVGGVTGMPVGTGGPAPGAGSSGTAAASSGSIPPGAVAAVASDPRLKKNMRPADDLVDAFLKHVDPKSYEYVHASDEPTNKPTRGRYLGVSADDLDSSPMGRQLIEKDDRGMKHIKALPLVSALTAGVGRLNSRVAELERGRKV